MKRIRVAGIVKIEDKFALIHRTNVKDNSCHNYYAFPGGGLEEESKEEGTIREIKEELGIDVKIVELLYTFYGETMDEYFYLCEYVGGDFGTGDGPEFDKNAEYEHRGEYTPVLVLKEEVEELLILPPQAKEVFVNDIKKGKFE